MTYQELENKYPLASLEFTVAQAKETLPERGDESDEDFFDMIEEALLHKYIKHFGALGIGIVIAPCALKPNGDTYQGRVLFGLSVRHFSRPTRNEAYMRGIEIALGIRESQLESAIEA